MWEMYEIDLKKCTEEALLEHDNLIELDELYDEHHQDVDLSLLNNFE
jgi:hypothetical protein